MFDARNTKKDTKCDVRRAKHTNVRRETESEVGFWISSSISDFEARGTNTRKRPRASRFELRTASKGEGDASG